MTHNNKDNSPLLDALIQSPIEVYGMLLTNGACQRILALHLPGYLTRVNALLYTVSVTTSRKFRQRYIRQLATILSEGYTTANGTYTVGYPSHGVLHKLIQTCCDVVTEAKPLSEEQLATVRRVDITNSPWWSALQIGDSKHYTSCLRSGLQREYPSPNPHVPQMTEEDWLTQIDTQLVHTGCNYRTYIKQEVQAFKSGELVYYGVGTMPHEGGDGWLARVRVQVIDGDAYIEPIYGDVGLLRILYTAVSRDFDNAYAHALGKYVTRYPDSHTGVYTSYDPGDKLGRVTTEPVPTSLALRLLAGRIEHTRHDGRTVWGRYKPGMTDAIAPNYYSMRNNGIGLREFITRGIARLLGCTAATVRHTNNEVEFSVPVDAKLRTVAQSLMWTHYGCKYTFQFSNLIRSNRLGDMHIYNFTLDKWQAYKFLQVTQSPRDYYAPRHKCKWIVNTLMPKSLRKR